jgi:hypothetical protein
MRAKASAMAGAEEILENAGSKPVGQPLTSRPPVYRSLTASKRGAAKTGSGQIADRTNRLTNSIAAASATLKSPLDTAPVAAFVATRRKRLGQNL